MSPRRLTPAPPAPRGRSDRLIDRQHPYLSALWAEVELDRFRITLPGLRDPPRGEEVRAWFRFWILDGEIMWGLPLIVIGLIFVTVLVGGCWAIVDALLA
jgi:hypothetical protein